MPWRGGRFVAEAAPDILSQIDISVAAPIAIAIAVAVGFVVAIKKSKPAKNIDLVVDRHTE